MTARRPSGQFTRQRSARVKRRQLRERGYLWCSICGGEIDPGLRFPHPGSWSVDHVVPISQGGADDDGNVDGSHLACNQTKGDGRGTQPAAIEQRTPCRPDPDAEAHPIEGGWSKHHCLTHGGWLTVDQHGDPAGDPTRCSSVPW